MKTETLETPDGKQAQCYHRWMIRRDLPDVLAMEEASTSSSCRPWDLDTYERVLRKRNCIGRVCEVQIKGRDEPVVVGVLVYALIGKRFVKVRRLLVHPAWRRRGVARGLLQNLMSVEKVERHGPAVADVPEKALDVQLFLSKGCRFRATRIVEKRSTKGGRRTCYRMVFSRRDAAACPSSCRSA